MKESSKFHAPDKLHIHFPDQGAEGEHGREGYSLLGGRAVRRECIRGGGAAGRRARLADRRDDPAAGGPGSREPALPRLLPAARPRGRGSRRRAGHAAPARLHAAPRHRHGSAHPHRAPSPRLEQLLLPRRHPHRRARQASHHRLFIFSVIRTSRARCYIVFR